MSSKSRLHSELYIYDKYELQERRPGVKIIITDIYISKVNAMQGQI